MLNSVSEKEQLAEKTVKRYMLWSVGAALIPIPFADIVALLAAQLKMIAEIAKIYGVPFKTSRGKALVASLLGAIVPQALSFGAVGSLLKAIPVVGAMAGVPSMIVFCGASAWALGKVFIQHFESGGTFLNFDPEQVKEYFKAQFDEGRKVASTMHEEKAGI